jgi:hypothetical protein
VSLLSKLSKFALVLQADDTFGSAYGGRVFGKAMTDLVPSDSADIDVIAI